MTSKYLQRITLSGRGSLAGGSRLVAILQQKSDRGVAGMNRQGEWSAGQKSESGLQELSADPIGVEIRVSSSDYSIGLRNFLRLRLRASADLSRRFSPGGTKNAWRLTSRMMSSCCTLRLKRRSALSSDSPSPNRTSAKRSHLPTGHNMHTSSEVCELVSKHY